MQGAVKDTIELLQKMYKIRNCNKSLVVQEGDCAMENGRPCLNYHIGQCNAPCRGLVSKEAYSENVKAALGFLEGNYNQVIKELESKIQQAAEELDFERAMEYRDLIQSINHVAGNQKITTHQFEDRDIIAYAEEGNDAVVQVFFVRNGKLIGREHFI